MKYKDFIKTVRYVYIEADEHLVSPYPKYRSKSTLSKYADEICLQALKDLDFEQLEFEDKRGRELKQKAVELTKEYDFDISGSYLHIMGKQYYVTKALATHISNLKDNFEAYKYDLFKIISCESSFYMDYIPCNNWRLCKIFKVKPAVKINPKLVLPDNYVDKVTATYFDLIRHGIINEN